MLKCLQNEDWMCLLLWGDSTWQSAVDRIISNISRGIASLWILRKEIHVSGLTGAYSHPAVVTYLWWSVPLAYKIQTSGASFSRGHLSSFRRFNLSLRGFREYWFFPHSALSEVWFSHRRDLVMFSAYLGILEILHRLLFCILKVAVDTSSKVSLWTGRPSVGKYQLGGTDIQG